jgi:hypothetical protein
MGLRFDSESTGKWWELLMAWKWPHEGFTVGYDFIQPNETQLNSNMTLIHQKILKYIFLI